jgi:hypothetical protein
MYSKAAHRELIHRPIIQGWTPERLFCASARADGGSLSELADLVEMIRTDDRVDGVLSTRTHGLLGLPVEFSGGDRLAADELRGEDDLPGEWWSMHPESELSKLLAWGILLGVGLAQRVALPRVVGHPQRYRIEAWSPRWLRYQERAVGQTHWRVQTQDGEVPVMPGDGEWILYTPYGSKRPWMEGAWKSIAFPVLLKKMSLEDRANMSEALGSPIWVGMTSKGSTERQRNKFLAQLEGLGKSGKLVLPEGWDMVLRESASKSWEIYTEQVKWADSAIAVSLTGQIVTTEGTSGFSSGNIHEAIKQDFIRYDAETLSTCLRDQSLRQWALVNHGSLDAAPWPRWRTQRQAGVADEATGASAIADAIEKLNKALVPHGLKIDPKPMLEAAGIPFLPTGGADA